ncbi:MAG: arsenate reductase ArsC [Armatimonadetes bacterium]|nr:arsenate reductase ArsC [Armatimonadota bacterium]
MERPRVLFLCTGNSCRSQMAEGWLRHLAGEAYDALSAGTDPHWLNPFAVQVMGETGVDISGHTSDSLEKFADTRIDYFITVCDRAAESCPLPPPGGKVLRWSFEDPPGVVRESGLEGERALEIYRRVRDEIRAAVEGFVADSSSGGPPQRP